MERLQDKVSSFTNPQNRISIVNFVCDVGGVWKGEVNGRQFRIVVHGIAKVKNKNEYRADVEVSRGVGALFGGEFTTRIDAARYWIPIAPAHGYESSCVYRFDSTLSEVYSAFLRVEHINPNAKNVSFILCVTTGRAEIIDGSKLTGNSS